MIRRLGLHVVAATLLGSAPLFAGHELEGRDISMGEALYADNCASCHGADLEGQPEWRSPGPDGILPAPPHDETGHTWHHDNQLIFDYTRLGGQAALDLRGIGDFKSGMPAFGETLTDDEIWNILAFIRSTWPERVQQMHSARNNPNH